jgi:hypothetical protein
MGISLMGTISFTSFFSSRASARASALAALLVLATAMGAGAQSAPPEFAKLVSQLTPSDGGPETPQARANEEQALAILDRAALQALNSVSPDLDALNRNLAGYITRTPALGEGYKVAQLLGTPVAYALVADFGADGPSAVRVYAGAPGKLALAGRVDRYAQKDFADDCIELVPYTAGNEPIFVTVSGRTDELETGLFMAWRFDGREVTEVWSSDVLQESSYEMVKNGFQITFCVNPDSDDIHNCLARQQDRYMWQDGKWALAETMPLPGSRPKPTPVR